MSLLEELALAKKGFDKWTSPNPETGKREGILGILEALYNGPGKTAASGIRNYVARDPLVDKLKRPVEKVGEGVNWLMENYDQPTPWQGGGAQEPIIEQPGVTPPVINWGGQAPPTSPVTAPGVVPPGEIDYSKEPVKGPAAPPPGWWEANKDQLLAGLGGMAAGASQQLPVGGGSTGLLLSRAASGMFGGMEAEEAKQTEAEQYQDLLGFKQEEMINDRVRAEAAWQSSLASLTSAEAQTKRATQAADKSKTVGSYRVEPDPNAGQRGVVAANAAQAVLNGVPNDFYLRMEAMARQQRTQSQVMAHMAAGMDEEEARKFVQARMLSNDEETQSDVLNRMAVMIKGFIMTPIESIPEEDRQQWYALIKLGGAQAGE